LRPLSFECLDLRAVLEALSEHPETREEVSARRPSRHSRGSVTTLVVGRWIMEHIESSLEGTIEGRLVGAASLEGTIEGRLVGAAGRTDPAGVTVWFSYVPAGEEGTTVETTADAEGRFTFALPSGAMTAAKVGAHLEGVPAVDLEPNGEQLEPGDLVLIVDDIIPSHVRFAG